jgi:hypothetical protein
MWRGGASVLSSGKNHFRKFSAQFHLLSILFLIALIAAAGSLGQPAFADGASREAAQRLAERVAGIPGLHGALRLEWHPDERWSEGEGERWRKILSDEFESRSLSLTEDPAAPALSVFAEETPVQVVLSAKARVSDRDEIRIVAVARALLPPDSLPVAPIRLEHQMIYESADRILDASSIGNGTEGGLGILFYKNFEIVAVRVDSKGIVRQSVSLNAANLKPSRDPRAEMTLRGNMVSVELTGRSCEFSWEPPSDVKCHVEKPAAGDKPVRRGATLLSSPCDGSGWKLLSSGGEPGAREVLQVVPDGALRENSAAVLSEFSGPILGTSGEQNSGSALVVTRNLRTGNYEIYKITLACGN